MSPEWLTPSLLSLGVTFLGWLLVEVRGLRADLNKFSERLAHVEGRLSVEG